MADEKLRAASQRYVQTYNDWTIEAGNAMAAEAVAQQRRAGADATWAKVAEARDELIRLASEADLSTAVPE